MTNESIKIDEVPKENTGEELTLITIGIPEKELPNFLAALDLYGFNITLPEYIKKLAEFWTDNKTDS